MSIRLRRSISGFWAAWREHRLPFRRRHARTRAPSDPQREPRREQLLPDRLPAGLLLGADVVVVDIETTGWLADAAAITEIGALRLSCDEPAEEFAALVNPGHPIPAAITELTGISDDMVRHAPPIGEVLPKFLEFASGCVVVAHNAPFDLGFLRSACADNAITWPPCAVIDTAVLARLVLPPGEVPDHKLTTLAGYFGTRTGPCHRALADAKATAGVLISLLARLGASTENGDAAAERADLGVAAGSSTPSRYDCAAARPGATRIEEAMMITAIVLIKTDVARIPETAEAIAQLDGVSEVYSVTGEFDLVAMVRVRSHEDLGDVIPGHVNKVAGVTHTETHIAFRTYSRHDLDAAFSIGYPEPS